MPINIHRVIANVAFGGSVAAAYAAFKFLQAKTDEERAHYDWMGYVGNFVAILAFLFRHEQRTDAAPGGGIARVLESAFAGLEVDQQRHGPVDLGASKLQLFSTDLLRADGQEAFEAEIGEDAAGHIADAILARRDEDPQVSSAHQDASRRSA